MIRVYRQGVDMTALTTACQVEKNLSAAGAQAAVTLIYAPHDRYLPKINPACGDAVRLEDAGGLLFEGMAERVDFSGTALQVTLTCFDPAARLAKNELFGVFKGTPAHVAAQVLERLELGAGSLWAPEETVYIPAGAALTGHQIIRQAYGGRCAVRWLDGAVHIVEPGARQAVLKGEALLEVTAGHSVEEMANRALMVGYQGRTDALAQNAGHIAAYGLRQRVYTLSGPRSAAFAQAGSHLAGPVRQAEITLLGGARVSCGDRIELGWPEYGLAGSWLVTRAAHQMAGGLTTTRLGLREVM